MSSVRPSVRQRGPSGPRWTSSSRRTPPSPEDRCRARWSPQPRRERLLIRRAEARRLVPRARARARGVTECLSEAAACDDLARERVRLTPCHPRANLLPRPPCAASTTSKPRAGARRPGHHLARSVSRRRSSRPPQHRNRAGATRPGRCNVRSFARGARLPAVRTPQSSGTDATRSRAA
jgi:hypothetical protein